VTTADLERARERLRAQGLSEATCNRRFTFLRMVYRSAIRDELIDRHPVAGSLFFREGNQRVRYLSDDEEQRLRQAMGGEHWPKVTVALHTGFRQGNQFRLAWEDVNFEAGSIRACRSKSGHDYYVPMNDELRAILRSLPSRLRSAWVFPSDTGDTPLDPKNFLHRVFYPALKEAKITGLRWHDLRHSFASRPTMAGVDLKTVQGLMGHKTLRMTERYAHLSPAHKRDAVQRLVRQPSSTTSSTERPEAARAVAGDAPNREARRDVDANGRCRDRTCDPRLVRPMLSR
jgi:site-specific recombinase XerD